MKEPEKIISILGNLSKVVRQRENEIKGRFLGQII